MKKLFTAILTVFLVLSMTAVPVICEGIPSQKEEVVYGILNPDGSVDNLYAVNIFSSGEITDFGNYSKILNLSTSENINRDSDKITVNTSADKLYYQGTLVSKELPWNISVYYFLDGKEIAAPDLAGKSGALEITVSVTENGRVNRTFFSNFALQITLALDTKLCIDIKADSATIVEAGGSKQLVYTVLPGKTASVSVTADIHDFEMEPITLNGIRMSLGIDINTDKITEQITQLTDAVRQLDGGAGELLDGAKLLADSMEKYVAGLKEFKDGMSELSAGINQSASGANELSKGLAGLSEQKSGLISGAEAIQKAVFDAVNAQLAPSGLPALTSENYSAILAGNQSLAPVLAQLDGAVQFTAGLKSYTNGVGKLGTGASQLASGLSHLNAAASVLPSSVNNLYNAVVQLNTGIKQLCNGIEKYKSGINALNNGTSDFESQINKMTDEILKEISGNGDKPQSFVSDKNTNVTAVQFLLKSSAIKKPAVETAAAEKLAEPNLWQKLLRLFGL